MTVFHFVFQRPLRPAFGASLRAFVGRFNVLLVLFCFVLVSFHFCFSSLWFVSNDDAGDVVGLLVVVVEGPNTGIRLRQI